MVHYAMKMFCKIHPDDIHLQKITDKSWKYRISDLPSSLTFGIDAVSCDIALSSSNNRKHQEDCTMVVISRFQSPGRTWQERILLAFLKEVYQQDGTPHVECRHSGS